MSDTSTTAGLGRHDPRVVGAEVADFVALLKPRVMSLVVFTAIVGLWLAPGPVHPVIAFTAILCIAVGAGAAGAINMWYDRDIDAVMSRTRARPIPAGRVDAGDALAFGAILGSASVVVMAVAVGFLAAALLAASILFYVFIYTIWLKRRTPQNIVIGGAAGAFPPVIGWVAVTGSIDIEPLLMFLLIFLWTPPHFWALALYRSGDYDRAGVPMLPVVAGEAATKRQMLVYTLVLVPVTLAPVALGMAGWVYGVPATALAVAFVGCAVQVLRTEGDRWPRRMFGFSLLHLFSLFLLLLVDGLLWGVS